MARLPENHPLRFALNNEVHARPPEPLSAPAKISCIALITGWPYRDEDRAVVAELTARYGATPPGPGVKHYSVDLGDFHLVWERHTEFTRYTFIVKGDAEHPLSPPALAAAPADWVDALPGELILAANAALVDELPCNGDYAEIAARYFGGHALVGSNVTSGAGLALTDFRIHADGFSSFLIQNKSMPPWHAGRIVQRILEIETYRVMSLLALPVANTLGPKITKAEEELAEITGVMTRSQAVDEPALLERLTRLEAQIEQGYTELQFRFGAASAYYALVHRRIGELREERIKGMQTFQEFIERRLAPAMSTCAAAERRQQALSDRVERASQLLATRVNLTLERQNQTLLDSMNKRAELQVRLQRTVEGLSVAAITYYIVGIIGYLAKGAEAANHAINASLITGLSVPIVAAFAGFGLWRLQREFSRQNEKKGEERP